MDEYTASEEISTRLVVHSYDEANDTFNCEVEDLNYNYEPFNLPAVLLPILIGQGGEPSELVGRTFEL